MLRIVALKRGELAEILSAVYTNPIVQISSAFIGFELYPSVRQR